MKLHPIIATLCLVGLAAVSSSGEEGGTGVLLPDGREFITWEQPLQFSRTYYVDNRNTRAADTNPGTKELPFLTINKAAQVLQPGECVVIMTGDYRGRRAPARGRPRFPGLQPLRHGQHHAGPRLLEAQAGRAMAASQAARPGIRGWKTSPAGRALPGARQEGRRLLGGDWRGG